jgi:DNA repair protein RadC
MSIKDWPASERPREKLLRFGPAALSSAELLAIVLHHGRAGQTALDLARDLLKRFAGLRGLLSAERNRVCVKGGLGVVRYTELQAAMEIARRALEETLERPEGLSSPSAARRFLQAKLRDLPHEVFCCFYLV